MPPKSASLASLLGTLTSAAPVDFDPEALEADQAGPSTFTNGSDASDSQDDDEDEEEEDDDEEGEEDRMNPRAHYADVGPSDMRKKAALSESDRISDPRYQGVKSSRVELYGDGDEDEEDGDEEDDDEDQDVASGLEDEGDASEDEEEDSDNDDDEDDASIPAKATKQLRFADDNDDDEASSQSTFSETDESSSHAPASASIAAQITQSATQAKQLKARRLEDAEKGRAVRKQIKTYERTLETRIKAQSVLRDVNRLPDPSPYSETLRTSTGAMEGAIGLVEQLLELSETLFSLRTRLATLSSEDDAVTAPASRKRKRDFDVPAPDSPSEAEQTWSEVESHEQIDATLSDIVSFSEAVEGQRCSVLDKWSLKVATAATSSGNKFAPTLRAVNQTPSAQIQSALAGDGLARLVSRTRVLRDDTPKLTTSKNGDEDAEVFDDSDFYSTLLKDLIERRSSSAAPATAAMLLTGLQGGKKKKQNVDTKASKGRKLRYEVNEKLVNFMPPIGDRLRWGEEQIDRLFRQLASSTGLVEDREESGEEEEEVEEAGLDGLRVFG
ncbi:Apoptosis-antagonizing transcription factor, C-terminal [Kalmanozyma brasiliensis GHG001]|uniref:Protein BFR2 n=1 Tax=Kalmanozyma brasiliensis (strain GHG001) TaxID=1365824 RepID=V5EE49_KALBG|nr:Apoptosis-antagonizing transcription factor, C-terminal [Kalmanozyma brasiliensis GHG001]EST08756.1 Apoptosis-antagonizing transcription factor, C-terminal [Kalmanozyma brasiliensis GHG001]